MQKRNHSAAKQELPVNEVEASEPKSSQRVRETGPELDEAEAGRRAKIENTFKKAVQLDREFFTKIEKHDDLLASVDAIETVESLAFGGELDREPVSGFTQNQVSRRFYDGDPVRVAYVKPQSSETFLTLDKKTGRAIQIRRSRDSRTGKLSEIPDQLHEKDEEQATRVLKEQPAVCAQIADAYGILVKDLPVHPDVISNRISIPIETGPIREYTVSRIDMFLRFDVVMPTVLRKEVTPYDEKKQTGGETIDLMSAQESAPVSARPMNKKDYEELMALGPKHPGAKSFMRIACLHYLVQCLDGQKGNILYDEETQQFYSIDNATSFPLKKRLKHDDPSQDCYADKMVSLPLEIIAAHPTWLLDDEALAELKRLLSVMYEYEGQRKAIKAAKEQLIGNINPFEPSATTQFNTAGAESKYLTSLLRLQFGNEKIAEREANEFAARLMTLASRGRPPKLDSRTLTPISHLVFAEDVV